MSALPGVVPYLPSQPRERDQYDPLGTGQTRRRGLFGRAAQSVGRILGNDGNPETPNLWDWIALGPRAPDILQERAYTQQTRRRESEQHDALEQAIGGLPERMRPWGRIAPEVVARQVLAEPEAPDWELDPVTGQPYHITPQGQVQYGQGRVSVQQRGGDGSGQAERAPPSGYRWTADGGLEPVPGGPADVRANAEGRARASQLQSSEDQLERAENAVNRAIPLVRGNTTGVFAGGLLRPFNQGATDLHETLEPARAILSFETLQEMRRNSATGGALGSIAVRELELLGSVYESLSTAQSEGALRAALTRLSAQLRRARLAVLAARREMEQPGGAAQPSQGGARVIELDP